MTIGIAAAGPGAASAILEALRTVETIGRGAIGGFVSLAAVDNGRVERAEVQNGGALALFAKRPPDWLARARCAVLMSSGPNRPAPLSQFTPGAPAIGFVTGHRFPNSPDERGRPLNLAVLELMAQGLDPQAAVDRVAEENPQADAGLLAITPSGQVGLRDCTYLEQFADRGHARLASPQGAVAVTHNAIAPHRGLALVAAEVALTVLHAPAAEQMQIVLRAGVPLRHGQRNAVEIDDSGHVVSLTVTNPQLLTGTRSFGLGYRAAVTGARAGYYLQYEPYMVSCDGILQSIDGARIGWLTCAGR